MLMRIPSPSCRWSIRTFNVAVGDDAHRTIRWGVTRPAHGPAAAQLPHDPGLHHLQSPGQLQRTWRGLGLQRRLGSTRRCLRATKATIRTIFMTWAAQSLNYTACPPGKNPAAARGPSCPGVLAEPSGAGQISFAVGLWCAQHNQTRAPRWGGHHYFTVRFARCGCRSMLRRRDPATAAASDPEPAQLHPRLMAGWQLSVYAVFGKPKTGSSAGPAPDANSSRARHGKGCRAKARSTRIDRLSLAQALPRAMEDRLYADQPRPTEPQARLLRQQLLGHAWSTLAALDGRRQLT